MLGAVREGDALGGGAQNTHAWKVAEGFPES